MKLHSHRQEKSWKNFGWEASQVYRGLHVYMDSKNNQPVYVLLPTHKMDRYRKCILFEDKNNSFDLHYNFGV